MRVLLVEDDEVIAEQIAAALQRERYVVDVALDGEEGSDMAAFNSYGLVVLDIMLPKKDGWTICREIRNRKDAVPDLMLTARDSVDDRIKGLDGGADDYLPKPFDIRELLARVKALLRRDKVHRTGLIRVGDLEINANAHNEESLENSVNFHVTSLRRKVDAPFEKKLIHTVHGIGYVLRSAEG